MKKFLIGIDEVGRGPLAGPVSIGVALVPVAFDIGVAFPGIRDSKKMTEKARGVVASLAESFREQGKINFGVYSVPAEVIDEQGIEFAIQSAVEEAFQTLMPNPDESIVFLDGRLKAPKEFEQESLIGGDDKVPVISLASVVAKVHRDSYMETSVAEMYPQYGFEKHKGYGTKYHIDAIKEHGLSPVHRKSFLTRILPLAV